LRKKRQQLMVLGEDETPGRQKTKKKVRPVGGHNAPAAQGLIRVKGELRLNPGRRSAYDG